jgi:hypothetical protein
MGLGHGEQQRAEETRRRNMGRKLIVMLMTLVGCTCASSTALAAPNADYASGQAIVISPDAHS